MCMLNLPMAENITDIANEVIEDMQSVSFNLQCKIEKRLAYHSLFGTLFTIISTITQY